MLGRADIHPGAGACVGLEVCRGRGSGDGNACGKGGRRKRGTKQQKNAEQHRQPPASTGFMSCHLTSFFVLPGIVYFPSSHLLQGLLSRYCVRARKDTPDIRRSGPSIRAGMTGRSGSPHPLREPCCRNGQTPACPSSAAQTPCVLFP